MQIETQKELREYLSSITPIAEWREMNYIKNPAIIHSFWNLCNGVDNIRIVGDYDVDGICSTHIMMKALKEQFPEKNISYRLPKRIAEGYGMSRNIINEINRDFYEDRENTLIITVDNGISQGHLLNPLEAEGYKVCILDHHQLSDTLDLPQVSLCVDPAVNRLPNPLQGDYWCATGLCYQLARPYVSEELDKELETFAGLATVADCMELKEGNWLLVRNAIDNVRANKIADSLKMLLLQLNQVPYDCTEDTFGFYLGPCFNACSRLYDAADRVEEFLLNPTSEEAEKIKNINLERRELSESFTELAINKVKELGKDKDYPLWLYYPDMPEGLVGIVAGHLTETFECPVILLTNTEMEDDKGNNVYKGSARTYGSFNIYEYLYANRDKLYKFGGHKGAAGLSIADIYYEELSHISADRAELEESATPLNVQIDHSDIPSYLNIIETYRPFGQGRLLPIFTLDINLNHDKDRPLVKKFIGKAKEHIAIEPPFGRYKIMHFYHTEGKDDQTIFHMVGKLSRSTFRGVTTPTFIADVCEGTYENERLSPDVELTPENKVVKPERE